LIFSRKVSSKKKPGVSSESKSIIVRGIDIHYQIVGEGPPILFLHGIGASIFTWRFLAPLLSEKYSLVLVDIPGFGLSSKSTKHDYSLDGQAEILHEFLEKIGYHQTSIIGSSMGGLIALWMARRWPESHLQVVSIAPPLNPKVIPFNVSAWHRLVKPISLAVNEQLVRQILRRVLYNKELITNETVYKYTEPYLDSGQSAQTFMLATKTVKDKRVPNELREIKSQVLFLWGEQDQIIPVSTAKIGTTNVPHAYLSTHPEAGHHPMEDQPEWVAERVEEFFSL